MSFCKLMKHELNEARLGRENTSVFTFTPSLFDMVLRVASTAQNPERAYNEKDVFLEISYKSSNPLKDGEVSPEESDLHTWISGEKLIELGTQLIKSGNDALTRSRLNNYETIELLAAMNMCREGHIKQVVITKQSEEQPEGYGSGYFYYTLLYIADDDLYSREIKDVVIYWSPFKDHFDAQLLKYTCGISVHLTGFSYEEVKKAFDDWSKEMEAQREKDQEQESELVVNKDYNIDIDWGLR